MANFLARAAVSLRPAPTPSASSMGDAAPVDLLAPLLARRRARAAFFQARADFDSARKYAHAHPEDDAAWRLLRVALGQLERESAALARLSHSPP